MRDKRNYLDFVPVKNPQLPWQEDEGAIVTVEVTHRGLAAKVAQQRGMGRFVRKFLEREEIL